MVDPKGDLYQLHYKDLENYAGWQVFHLNSLTAISKAVYDPLIRFTGFIILSLCVLIGLAVFFLYRQASHEIWQRRSAEEALRNSEERYRSLYHQTPAMLHSIDPEGRIVSVSDFWVEVMGYEREEVIGRKLTDFFTEQSRQLRRLSGSIMANQEKERSAIARELHDELGQVLTALRMDSVWMHERLKTADPEAAERALTMCRLIDMNIEDVRGMAFRLRPGVLDDLGLVDALESYTADFERRTEITCVFEHEDIPVLSETVSTAVFLKVPLGKKVAPASNSIERLFIPLLNR